jgi:single-strand DNA-binding protein
MAGYETCTIVGNVGRDPETRVLPNSGTTVCSFSVAVTTRWNDRTTNERREKTTWYNVSCFSRLADVANQYVRKGTQILVVGTVSARAYMGSDGQPKASLDLRADTFQLLGSRGDAAMNAGTGSDHSYGSGGGYDERDYAPPAQDMDDIPF